MGTALIPASTKLAAKRAFIRTAAQTLSVSIPTAGVTGAALSDADPAMVAWVVGAALFTSLGTATASALDILARGVPDEYSTAAATDKLEDLG